MANVPARRKSDNPCRPAIRVQPLRQQAEKLLRDSKFERQGSGDGRAMPRNAKFQQVFAQSPNPGTKYEEGEVVSFEYYAGVQEGDYVGLKRTAATQALQKSTLKAKIVVGKRKPPAELDRYKVYEQRPLAGEWVAPDSEVTITVYADEGFRKGDGALVDRRFADAMITDGYLPDHETANAGPRTAIYAGSAQGGATETRQVIGWGIKKFADAGTHVSIS